MRRRWRLGLFLPKKVHEVVVPRGGGGARVPALAPLTRLCLLASLTERLFFTERVYITQVGFLLPKKQPVFCVL